MNILQKPVQHYGDRGKYKPELVVIHVGEGSQQIIYETFLNEQKSSHYCVSRKGEIWQFVQEGNAAWHAGVQVSPVNIIVLKYKDNPNLYSIGIEAEGFGSQEPTDEYYTSVSKLVYKICTQWDIPIDRTHICRHHEIRWNKECPGNISVDKIVAMALILKQADSISKQVNEVVSSPAYTIPQKVGLMGVLVSLLQAIKSYFQ